MRTIRLLIKGKVQGVFYRATAKDIADKLGLKGWIKNTEAGDVEAVAIGTEEAIAAFIAWCQHGPKTAKVADVIVNEIEEPDFKDFQIKR